MTFGQVDPGAALFTDLSKEERQKVAAALECGEQFPGDTEAIKRCINRKMFWHRWTGPIAGVSGLVGGLLISLLLRKR